MDKRLSPAERLEQATQKLDELKNIPFEAGSHIMDAMARMMLGVPRIVDIPLPSRAHIPE